MLHPLVICTCLAVMLLVLLMHLLTLTIVTGLFIAHLAIYPLWQCLGMEPATSGLDRHDGAPGLGAPLAPH